MDNEQSQKMRGEENLRFWVSRRRLVLELVIAALSGVLLALAFPPAAAAGIAWIALIPLLLLPVPRVLWRRLLIGYVFGAAHFIPSLWWLNEIGFGAGVLLATACAVFPMLWYLLLGSLAYHLPGLRPPRRTELQTPQHIFRAKSLAVACSGLLLASGWCGLEWIRSWLFTGFPWNQAGISQWRHTMLLKLSSVTGVYGISFLIIFTNFGLGWMLVSWINKFRKQRQRQFPWPPAVAIVVFLPVVVMTFIDRSLPPPDRYIRVAGIQGNLSQRREWTPGQLDEAIDVYEKLSLQAEASVQEPLDLIIWPETALPAAVQWNRKAAGMLRHLFTEIDAHFLIGSLDFRTDEMAGNGKGMNKTPPMTNSAILFSPDGERLDYYDKIHRVPFGEYVPFGEQLPWLVDMIGMGRALTPGAEYTVFNLPGGARGGVNICYEDVYPEISRAFVQRGANLLLTLTNDAWYAESAGSRQHMTHAVFRAAENRRPLFRSGNNSDTCLIQPSGKVQGLLYDPVSGSPFIRGYKIYEVPVWDNLPATFYTLYGDWFAKTCAAITLTTVTILTTLAFRRKYRKFTAVTESRGH